MTDTDKKEIQYLLSVFQQYLIPFLDQSTKKGQAFCSEVIDFVQNEIEINRPTVALLAEKGDPRGALQIARYVMGAEAFLGSMNVYFEILKESLSSKTNKEEGYQT